MQWPADDVRATEGGQEANAIMRAMAAKTFMIPALLGIRHLSWCCLFIGRAYVWTGFLEPLIISPIMQADDQMSVLKIARSTLAGTKNLPVSFRGEFLPAIPALLGHEFCKHVISSPAGFFPSLQLAFILCVD